MNVSDGFRDNTRSDEWGSLETRTVVRFLPYVVKIRKRSDIRPVRRKPSLTWSIVVCDREYNLLFATWLLRRPTRSQVAAFAGNYESAVDWDSEGGTNYLYHDKSVPTGSSANWSAYSERLNALSRLKCLHQKYWSSRTTADYDAALERW